MAATASSSMAEKPATEGDAANWSRRKSSVGQRTYLSPRFMLLLYRKRTLLAMGKRGRQVSHGNTSREGEATGPFHFRTLSRLPSPAPPCRVPIPPELPASPPVVPPLD